MAFIVCSIDSFVIRNPLNSLRLIIFFDAKNVLITKIATRKREMTRLLHCQEEKRGVTNK
ncbi:hypothetical protein ED28_00565 [[Pantoea] beijingensis]|uniref:Uncharacterized protein n=1 Tax=[Pantoea] beijingensis TaxID=1324864 RepID=A0A443IHL8_9GAMM|nr:hypothetical protein ED28_00565 [[Pantoea] beijingensis]